MNAYLLSLNFIVFTKLILEYNHDTPVTVFETMQGSVTVTFWLQHNIEANTLWL